MQLATPLPMAAPSEGSAVLAAGAGEVVSNIQTSRVIVLTAPLLTSTAVAEAVRIAITQGGAAVFLITNRSGLVALNSLSFRVALMGAATYVVQSKTTLTPFLITDTASYEGPGVTGLGPIRRMNAARTQTLARWARQVTGSVKPTPAVTITRDYFLTNFKIKLGP